MRESKILNKKELEYQKWFCKGYQKGLEWLNQMFADRDALRKFMEKGSLDIELLNKRMNMDFLVELVEEE